MSAILGIFGPDASRAPAREMLASMAHRGADSVDVWSSPGAVLGVSRHAWECAPGFAGPAAVARAHGCLCVSDASLYYRADLRRALACRGIEVDVGASHASMIIAAYRAWGPDLAAHLEGDFAFILWDARRHRVIASTEFTGKRPLFHASLDGGVQLVVSSTVRAITVHPACPDSLDPRILAATIAQLWAGTDETWHRSVREVTAGHTLVRQGYAPPRVARHWTPVVGTGPTMSFEDAAVELRRLLERATEERLAPTGPTATWMSGGWDSPSVFAAGRARLRVKRDSRELLPVSLSYPPGDPGREDELIQAVADHWQSPVRWIDVDTIPLFVDPARTAGAREGPYAHAYEFWNRRLAAESRALGARVALDGNGGDQLFQVSDIFLADLLRHGQLRTLAREWRAKGAGWNWRGFLEQVALPAAPPALRRPVEVARGRRFRGPMERVVPRWIRPEFLEAHQVLDWERAHIDPGAERDLWKVEAARFLLAPAFGRGFEALGGFARDAGVELRSPLLDARVVAFAMGRPREERNSGRETKRLLRRAMHTLLPDEFLAPRPRRTGITSAYSDRRMRESIPGLLGAIMAEPLELARMGIVDTGQLRHAWDDYLASGALHVKIPLFLTLHAEFWLRARRLDAAGRIGDARAAAPRPLLSGDVRVAQVAEVPA